MNAGRDIPALELDLGGAEPPPPGEEGPSEVTSLALDVAGCCNLACRYCAETATQPKRSPMPEDILEAAWDFLFPEGAPKRGYTIHLGSGEPLLNVALLRRLGELIRERGGCEAEQRPGVFLTTNGTRVDSETSRWLAGAGWHVKISLDGPKDINDAWRVTPDGKGVYEAAACAAARFAREIPESLSVTAVLCRGADPQEVFDGIAELGVRRIELVPVAGRDSFFLPDSADVDSYSSFVSEYSRRRYEAGNEVPGPVLVGFEKCVVRVMGYYLRSVPCGAGRSFFGVGPDGDLYPCFRFIGVDEYRLGRLPAGLDEEAVADFRCGPGRPYRMRKRCRKCWAAPLCGGPCFACTEMFGPGQGEPIELHCRYRIADAKAAVWLVNRLRETDPERLLTFLPGAYNALNDF